MLCTEYGVCVVWVVEGDDELFYKTENDLVLLRITGLIRSVHVFKYGAKRRRLLRHVILHTKSRTARTKKTILFPSQQHAPHSLGHRLLSSLLGRSVTNTTTRTFSNHHF